MIIAMVGNSVIGVWSAKTGAHLRTIRITVFDYDAPRQSDHAYGVCALPGSRFASGTDWSKVCVWDVNTGARLFALSHYEPVSRVCALLGDRLACVVGRKVAVWDLSDERIRSAAADDVINKSVASRTLCDDRWGQMIVCAMSDGRLVTRPPTVSACGRGGFLAR